ncbi:putative transcription factor AS2-LOB family [Rosa chinensis]|uniref:Putative transcription factor AS2-LOB family n=1 Tax=Rosa chinensis TaxID=74649 RepID=A0A2P6Q1A3_ROSCH|nr:LOB domain-containing protein 22 [Rosa chinensis]PRQ27972.1 putative transcription factor AS2-LOB family [Rosa chinensis]
MNKYQSCASCRHNRSKCVRDCPLAPYFPSHMHQKFKNARKVFGESHLKQLLRSLPPHKRSTAMKHIIAEADIRVADPVGGSYGLVRNLELKIAEEEEELRRLRNVLSVFRGRGSGSVVAQPLVQKQGYIVQEHDNINYQGYHIPVLPIVPGGFLHALLHQEQRNNMFDLRDEVVPEHDVNPNQGEEE